tara:strand:+ start:267 stop:557 length:291 start_codon:yes stop_codon:yes gene_type:complete
MKFRHVGIVCQNIDEMAAFYTSFGFSIVYEATEKVRVMKLQDPDNKGNPPIELLQYETMSDSILQSRGISHIAFTEDPERNMVEIVKEASNAVDES